MANGSAPQDCKVAVLVDCDNVSPEIVDHALLMGAQFGRVVLRRGYGNHATLANRWQEVMVQQAFTPCLQYQYAAGKNTSDIALALDAQEAMFDGRADTFCLVTSDSDFAYLCRKLRERVATVCIVGESKTPLALRNACDQFFLWESVSAAGPRENTGLNESASTGPGKVEPTSNDVRPLPKRRPRFLVDAVALLAGETSEGKVGLGALGQYLRRTNPSFTPNAYGHSGLLNMVKTYDLLSPQQEPGGNWSVGLAPSPAADAK